MNKNKAFVDWLFHKYLDWQREMGRTASQSEFARYLGISAAALSHYMNGRREPDVVSLDKIAMMLGEEAYQLAGRIDRDPRLRDILKVWEQLDEDGQRRVLDEALKWTKKKT